MKLATYEFGGKLSFGVLVKLNGEETLLDLYAAGLDLGISQADLTPVKGAYDFIVGGAEALDLVDRILSDFETLRRVGATADPKLVTFLAPLPNPGKIICVGANYPQHVAEIGEKQSDPAVSEIGKKLSSGDYPPAFAKLPSSLTGHGTDIRYPRHTTQLDYEAELAIIIGKDLRTVESGLLHTAIAAYTISNDVSARDVQFREMKRGLLLHGKNFAGAAPMGPYMTTADEIPDPQNLQISCWVNGSRRQHESTSQMIFNVAAVLEHYRHLPLLPGDILMTGSPAGVGIGMENPEQHLLKVGDVVEIEISGLGRLSNRISSAPGA